MTLLTVEGIYENGRVELAEQPAGVHKARVMVTFMPETDLSGRPAETKATLRRKFIARLKRGVDFGADPLPEREELYADRPRKF